MSKSIEFEREKPRSFTFWIGLITLCIYGSLAAIWIVDYLTNYTIEGLTSIGFIIFPFAAGLLGILIISIFLSTVGSFGKGKEQIRREL